MTDATHFEGKFYALRKTRDGLIVSFVVHPSDAPNDLITAPIGQQFMVALAPYEESPAGEPQERRTASQAPAGVAKTEGERAVQRAGILAKDARFQIWASGQVEWHLESTPEDAAEFIRRRCGIQSRRQLATDAHAIQRFYKLDGAFQAWAQDNPL